MVGVILNLAIWFALHVVFRQVREVNVGPVSVDTPVLTSLDPMILLLTLAAAVAVFRFKVGVIPVLLACAAAGLVWHLVQ